MRPYVLKDGFERARKRLGILPGTPKADALDRAVTAIVNAPTLPGPQDTSALLPVNVPVFFRRVPSQNLWLFYGVGETGTVAFYALVDNPPMPPL